MKSFVRLCRVHGAERGYYQSAEEHVNLGQVLAVRVSPAPHQVFASCGPRAVGRPAYVAEVEFTNGDERKYVLSPELQGLLA